MHVVIVGLRAEGYGGERVLRDVAVGLASSCLVTVVVFEGQSVPYQLIRAGVEQITIGRVSGVCGVPGLAWRMRRLIARLRPDCIITFMSFANMVACISMLGVRRRRPRIVLTEHNVTSIAILQERHHKLKVFLMRILYRLSDQIVGVSDAVVDDLVNMLRFRNGRVLRIYNSIDRSAVCEAGNAMLDRKDSRGTDKVQLVISGRLEIAKGHAYLLKALPSLNAHLTIVGHGREEANLRHLVDELGVTNQVTFCGFLENPYVEIRKADLFVLPSLWEGFGLAAVEAAALGVPVIASAVGGLVELVPTYVPGLLVPPQNSAALKTAIESFPSWGPALHDARLERFAPDIMIGNYLDVVCGRSSAPSTPTKRYGCQC